MPTIDPTRCLPLIDNLDQPADQGRDFCPHCDAPIGPDGFHHPQSGRDGGESLRRFLILLWDSPQQALVVAGKLMHKTGREIGERMEQLVGHPVTRQAVYDHAVKLSGKLPDLGPLLHERVHHTENKSAPAPRLCVDCQRPILNAARSSKRVCDECAKARKASRERKRRSQRGVHYPG